jgi:hypothetical protein
MNQIYSVVCDVSNNSDESVSKNELHADVFIDVFAKALLGPNSHIPKPRARWNTSQRRRKKELIARLGWAVGELNDDHTQELIDAVVRYYLRQVSSNTGKYRK